MTAQERPVRSHTTSVNGVRVHYLIAGDGEPVVLLHGWPQTSHEWTPIIPTLADTYTVIAPDLRGLGHSGKPQSGYDMNTVAGDIAALIDQLGFQTLRVVGHDWGAAAAYSLTAQNRELVTHLAVMEMVLPGFGIMEQAMTPAPAGNYLWHMGFQSVPDIPEMLITGREEQYLRHIFSHYAYDPDAISRADIQRYVDSVTEVGSLRAGLGYYRDFWTTAEQNREHARQKLTIPVMALAGAACLGELTAKCFAEVAEQVEGGVIEQCGHWVAAEQPAFLIDRLTSFLASESHPSRRLTGPTP
jgi:pimeloyl-ACP methyl ester carboxylesterase